MGNWISMQQICQQFSIMKQEPGDSRLQRKLLKQNKIKSFPFNILELLFNFFLLLKMVAFYGV